MYQGGLTKLDGNSFSLGFTQLSGANRNDSPLQSLATMNIGSNVEKQNANLITGITGSNLTQKSDAVANMSPADRLNAMANDRGLLEAYNVAYNAYAMSTDPDVRRAAKDHMIEKLQNSLAYATGMVKDDVKGFWTHAYQVVWEGNKVKLLDSDGNDITDDYWIAGNPQKQLKNNVQQIEEVAKNMLRLGATQAEIDNAMNQVINESVGADGRFESIGTAEDIGVWGDKVINNAPVIKQISSATETLGAGLRKAFSGGTIQSSEAYATSPEAGAGSSVSTTPSVGAEYSSNVTPVAAETQRTSNTNILDKAGEASLELFRLAGEGAEDLGTPVLEILKAAGEGVKEGGKVSEELYQQAKKELGEALSILSEKAGETKQNFIEISGDLLTAVKNFANVAGTTIKESSIKDGKLRIPVSEVKKGVARIYNNPGNVQRIAGDKWEGEIGAYGPSHNPKTGKAFVDGGPRFAEFDTPENGFRAMALTIEKRIRTSEGTLADVIAMYAPDVENDTKGYINNFKKKYGWKANKDLDFDNKDEILKLMKGILETENSDATEKAYNSKQIEEGYDRAFAYWKTQPSYKAMHLKVKEKPQR